MLRKLYYCVYFKDGADLVDNGCYETKQAAQDAVDELVFNEGDPAITVKNFVIQEQLLD